MSNLSFNMLTFNHPQDELTFYFTDKEQDGLTRIFHKLVPNEVIDKDGEQEHYYTSFEHEIEGFLPVIRVKIIRKIEYENSSNCTRRNSRIVR